MTLNDYIVQEVEELLDAEDAKIIEANEQMKRGVITPKEYFDIRAPSALLRRARCNGTIKFAQET